MMETKDMIMLLTSGQQLTSGERHEIALQLQTIAERLHRQESEIERLARDRGTMEWISVEDERKPRHLHNYFIAYVFGVCDEHFFSEAIYIADKGNGIVDGAHFNNEGVDGMRVTHWMEIPKLPEPPKPKEPTFKDVFLKAFPKAPLSKNGVPCVCIADVFPWGIPINCEGIRCNRCWNQPYFEEEEGGE